MRPYYFVLAAVVLALDQASKALVSRYISPDSVVPVVPGLFNLIYTRNAGVAFGILAESSSGLKTGVLVAFSAVVIAAVVVALWDERAARFTLAGGALSLILGGAVGNLADRVRSGSVVDFLDFYWRGHHWHTFNVADSAIVVGAILWSVSIWWPARRRS